MGAFWAISKSDGNIFYFFRFVMKTSNINPNFAVGNSQGQKRIIPFSYS
jgi:hypothetical protein